MRPANDPEVDYKALVREGYDACAADYQAARRHEASPELSMVIERLPADASVLDIGCGSGVPVTATLAQHARVTGVDISGEQIRLARSNVPVGEFIYGDIMTLEFPPSSFDAAVAYYSLFHLPREDHPQFFRRLRRWLKPGGHALLTVSRRAEPAYTEGFFGVSMYWSNWGLAEYVELVGEAGLTVLTEGSVGHGYDEATGAPPESHPFLLVRRSVDGER